MKPIKLISYSTLFALATSALFAQADILEERQALMKAMGQAMKTLTPIAEGKADFDQAAVDAQFIAFQNAAEKMGELFPEGSDTGETEAAPAIWSDRDGFNAAIEKFAKDVESAGTPKDEFELADAMQTIGPNCKACHQDYRIKK